MTLSDKIDFEALKKIARGKLPSQRVLALAEIDTRRITMETNAKAESLKQSIDKIGIENTFSVYRAGKVSTLLGKNKFGKIILPITSDLSRAFNTSSKQK